MVVTVLGAGQNPQAWMSHSEWVMGILTFIYVCATLFYVFTSHKTLKAIDRQATLADETDYLRVADKAAHPFGLALVIRECIKFTDVQIRR
jgi:hypothetical protein